MAKHMEAWKVNEKDFPHDGTDAEKLAHAVRYAILAPSPYNTQPWYFRIKGSTLYLCVDRRYGLAMVDPDDRELSICCAAALYNLRLAIRYFGYSETTELMPDPADEDILARVKLGEMREESLDDRKKDLFRAIPKRHMNRGAYSDKDVPEELQSLLTAAASKEGGWLHICGDIERKAIIRMVMEADHIQTANKNFRREMAIWVDKRREKSGDGMPSQTLSYEGIMGNLSPTVIRRFEGSDKTPANDRELSEGAPVIAVLGSNGGGAVERLSAGQALQRVLLTAEANGLAVSSLNQPCQVPELRLRLHDELNHHGRAHIILRIGYGGKPVYTPRRPLSSFIEFEGHASASAEKKIAGKKSPSGKPGLFKRLISGFGK